MSNNKQPGTGQSESFMNWNLKHGTMPVPVKAGDERVLVNGYPLTVDFRIVSEEKWQALQSQLQQAEKQIECWKIYEKEAEAELQRLSGVKWVSLENDEPEAEENCLWCKVPIVEPPYSGSMCDTDFPKNYFTHFMRLSNSFFPTPTSETPAHRTEIGGFHDPMFMTRDFGHDERPRAGDAKPFAITESDFANPSASKEEAPIREEGHNEQVERECYAAENYVSEFWYEQDRVVKHKLKMAFRAGMRKAAATPPQPQQIEDKDRGSTDWQNAFWSWVHVVESNEATTINIERKLKWINKHVVAPLQVELTALKAEIHNNDLVTINLLDWISNKGFTPVEDKRYPDLKWTDDEKYYTSEQLFMKYYDENEPDAVKASPSPDVSSKEVREEQETQDKQENHIGDVTGMVREGLRFDELFNEWVKFSLPTFKGATALISLQKLQDEMEETAHEIQHGTPGNLLAEEYVDCFMCLLDSMARLKITIPQFKKAFQLKLDKNKSRDWAKNENGTYSHVKSESALKSEVREEDIKQNLVKYFNGDHVAAEMAYSICFKGKHIPQSGGGWIEEIG